ncbi:MAG: GvpL/GvpF family gas vesicle protein [Bacteroidales bacterium]|jgi:hypothetical protein|nr:GvpL/GvpF family gas vesicle protein [Bacteroidales bacterium]
MINDLIYVYCISNSPPDLRKNNALEGLKCITFQGFYTVVKLVSYSEFSEENLKKNLSDITWLEFNARAHVRIISLLMEDCTVIPFKFGTIYHTQDSLKKFITDYSDSFIENFLIIQGKEEWSVKIYCDRRTLCERIDELSEEAATLEKEIMASAPGKAFLLRRKKADLIENELNKLTKSYGQEYYNEINKMSENTTLNNLLPKELTGREDTMILNSAFLVRKDKAVDFVTTISFLRKKYPDLGFDIEMTGPWPPFSFVSIQEKL